MRIITNPKKRIKAHKKVVALIESEPDYLDNLIEQYIAFLREEHEETYKGIEDGAMAELIYAGMAAYTTMPNVGVLEIDNFIKAIRAEQSSPFIRKYFGDLVSTIWEDREPTMSRPLAHGLVMVGFEAVGRTYDCMRLYKL